MEGGGEGGGEGGIHAGRSDNIQGRIGENEITGREEWTHPLLLPPVMNTVFENLSREGLSQCRLVCREWFNGSLSTWRKGSHLKFQAQGIFHVKPEGKLVTPLKEFKEFWNDSFNQCELKPFQYIQFREWVFSLRNPEWTGWLERNLLGHVTNLRLNDCKFSSLAEVGRVIYRACPNLVSLSMDSCQVAFANLVFDRFYPYSSAMEKQSYREPSFGEQSKLERLYLVDCLPDSWLSLLSHFPKLETLQFQFYDDESNLNLKALEAIKIIRNQHPGSLPLTNFKYEGAHEMGGTLLQECDLIRQLHFPLTRINIHLCDDMDHDAIRGILKYHYQTLTYFSGKGSGSAESSFEFPAGFQYPNLRSMFISYGFCENWNFLKYASQVQTIHLLDRESDRVHFQPHYLFTLGMDAEMMNLRLHNLTRIYLDFSVSDENLRRLVMWMPCMEVVLMVLNARQFQIACENWIKLKEITNTRRDIWGGDMNAICLDDSKYALSTRFRTYGRYFSQP